MSLKRYIALFIILMLVFSALSMTALAAEQAGETGETLPVDEAAEEKEEVPWAVTAMFLALITTFLQYKFIHGRR